LDTHDADRDRAGRCGASIQTPFPTDRGRVVEEDTGGVIRLAARDRDHLASGRHDRERAHGRRKTPTTRNAADRAVLVEHDDAVVCRGESAHRLHR
jgi:hypothetical protein